MPIGKFFGSAYRLDARAQGVVRVDERRQTVTSDLQFSCASSAYEDAQISSNADQSDNRRPRSPLGNPASVDPTNGTSLGRNILLSNDLRLLSSRGTENHADMCDTTFGNEIKGIRLYQSLLSCANLDITTLNFDVSPEGI